jgi:hypothetical protein
VDEYDSLFDRYEARVSWWMMDSQPRPFRTKIMHFLQHGICRSGWMFFDTNIRPAIICTRISTTRRDQQQGEP